jgi:hypothetical protein
MSLTTGHNGSAHWFCVCVCVCVGVCVWGGLRYLGCVSGGVATVISLGIKSSLGVRIRFTVGRERVCCLLVLNLVSSTLTNSLLHARHASRVLRPRMRALSLARLRSLGRSRTGV